METSKFKSFEKASFHRKCVRRSTPGGQSVLANRKQNLLVRISQTYMTCYFLFNLALLFLPISSCCQEINMNTAQSSNEIAIH
jgi:hypothetical protein